MEYEHHIFISYARGDLWTNWVRDMFVRRLQAQLQIEVGSVDVFVDDQIQTGARWENVLKHKVATSRLMIALLSADYFQREWCRREMALMFEREQQLDSDGRGGNYGLLIPIRLGDGDFFPDVVGDVLQHDLGEYADPELTPSSPRFSEFIQNLKKLAKTIAYTIPRVPPCSEAWRTFTGDSFYPRLGAKPFPPSTPPRLVV